MVVFPAWLPGSHPRSCLSFRFSIQLMNKSIQHLNNTDALIKLWVGASEQTPPSPPDLIFLLFCFAVLYLV